MKRYDVVVVGGGSAGCVLAARLSEDPGTSVILCEAGPDYAGESLPDELRQGNNLWSCVRGRHSWNYDAFTAGPGSRTVKIPRGRVIGGSSAINGQVVYRGLREDFDTWSAEGNTGWSYDEVLPYFKKLESDRDFKDEYHGTDGPIPVRRYAREEWLPHNAAFYDACRGLGFPDDPDMNGPGAEGVGARPLNNVDGLRISAATAYLDPARDRPNLEIRGDAPVDRILFNGDRATGVRLRTSTGPQVVHGGLVILCAGAIGSPRLLMLSGVGPAARLKRLGIPVVQDAPGVGLNLRDHPAVFVLFRATGLPTDPLAPPLQVGLRYTTPGSPTRNELQVAPILMTSEHRPQNVTVDGTNEYFGMTVGLQNASTSGTITVPSADPTVPPVLDYRYLSDERDLARMRHGVRLAARIAADEAFDGIVLSRVFPTDEQLADDRLLDQWLHASVTTQHHSSGTCKMGPGSDPLAVVDAHGRVRGVEGLLVVDASIMPDVVRANTHATVLMTAEKLADELRADSGRPAGSEPDPHGRPRVRNPTGR